MNAEKIIPLKSPGEYRNRLVIGIARVCGLLAAGIGLVALLGWIARLPLLHTFGSGRIPMAPSAALLFLLYGAGAVVLVGSKPDTAVHRIGTVVVSVCTLASLLLFVLSSMGIRPQVEHLGIRITGTLNGAAIGHISPLNAFCFVLIGFSFLASLTSSDRRWRASAACGLASLIVLTGFALFLAYLFGSPLPYNSGLIPPALSTSVALFILGTALLVSSGERSRPGGMLSDPARTRSACVLILVFTVLAAAVVTMGYLYYRNYETRYRAEVERQLSAVADLKVDELVDWRRERLEIASLFHRNDDFSGLVRRYLEAPRDADAGKRLRTWLGKVQAIYQYDRVLLLDSQGIERQAVPDTPEPAAPHLLEKFLEILGSGRVAFLDFHRDASDRPIHLAVLVPIFDEQDGGRPLGLLVLRIDPGTYLYPFIKRWPTPSRTAETLLVRREGNDALFLNDLRFQKNTALNLRMPLENVRVPAVKAALEQEGIVEGIDYRGVPVIAYVRSVPDSPWFLVAKVNTAEVYSPLRKELWLVLVFISVLLLAAGAGVVLVWRQHQARSYRERLEAAEALREKTEALEAMIRTSPLAFIVTDPGGVVTLWNGAAESMFGWSLDEVIGKQTPIVPPEKREEIIRVRQRMLDGETLVGLETERVRKDGARIAVSFSATALRDEAGRACSILVILADITERKRAEERERHLNAVLRAVRDVNQLITKEKDPDRLIQGACENLVETRGFKSSWIALMDESGRLVRAAEAGLGERFLPLKDMLKQGELPLCARKILTQTGVVVIRDALTECPSCPLASLFEDQAALCITLQHQGKTYGFLTASMSSGFVLDEEEQGLFLEVGEDIAFALHNIELEADQRRSEAMLRTIFDNAVDGILLAESETRRLVSVNKAMCSMLGYPMDELKKLSVRDIHPLEELPGIFAEFERQMKGEITLARDIPVKRKDGSLFLADVNSSSVEFNGRPHMLGVFRDITENKRTEEAIVASEMRYRRLFESAKDGILILDADTGQVVDANPFLTRLLGFSLDALREKHIWEIGSFKDIAASKDAFENLKQKEYIRYEDLPLETANGQLVQVEFVSNVYLVGRTRVIQCNIRDITERKRGEEERERLRAQLQQSQKLDAVGRLSGGIAHDFNNLLTPIIGNAEMTLSDMSSEDPLYEVMEEIRNAGARAASLTRQLLAFSRKQILQPEILDLNGVVRDMDRMLQRIIGEDIELKTVLSPDLGRVEADVGQMEQALMNLVVNARDAMPKGGKLTIETVDVELDEAYAQNHVSVIPGPYVMLGVSDTGVGMTKEVQEQIFEPFFTTKEKGKGTGLGLSTAYGIVKQSKGSIWVYSEPGKGSTFKVYLPRVEATAHVTVKPGKNESLQGAGTILVVEDEEMVRNMTLKILQRYGYTVLCARDGREAIRMCREHKDQIQLMLTDVVMPGMSGRELAEKLRAMQPGLKVLFMSGYTDDAVVHHGVLDEGVAFLQKPFTPEGLARKVRDVLGS